MRFRHVYKLIITLVTYHLEILKIWIVNEIQLNFASYKLMWLIRQFVYLQGAATAIAQSCWSPCLRLEVKARY